MAAKSRAAKNSKTAPIVRKSAAQREREARFALSRKAIDAQFRNEHPAIAAEERALRKAQAQRQRDWGHKVNGTIETHAQASQQRQGALARLYQSGAITIEQLGAAHEIAGEAERIGAGVALKSASLEARIDVSRSGADVFLESLGRVRREIAYTRWREAMGRSNGVLGVAPVLAMIVDDIGIVAVARHFGIHRRRALRMLIEAVELWPRMMGDVARAVDERDLAAMELRLR